MYKVLLIDDHQIVLDSLSLLLSSFEGLSVVGAYRDGRDGLDYYKNYGADLIISDMRMPNINGIEVCREARKVNKDAKVMILTMIEDVLHAREAMKIGINGYVLKNADAEELDVAIKTVLQGKQYFSEEVTVDLAVGRDESLTSRPGTVARLTLREVEVLRLVGKEMSTNEIADQLFISVPTVETHRRNLMQKIGAKSVVGLVLFAVKHDLLW